MSHGTNPQHELILHLLRILLENEEIAKFAIREYHNRADDLGCQEYVWTIACTF